MSERLTLHIQENCVICNIVKPVVEEIANKYNLPLNVVEDSNAVPAVPALLYKKYLLIGEDIPRELLKILN